MTERLGLIAGNGRFPELVARAARDRGIELHTAAFAGETDPALAQLCTSLTWVRFGQLARIARLFSNCGVSKVMLAGGFRRGWILRNFRPDLGALSLLRRLHSLRDDEFLRAANAEFEERGLTVVSPTDYVPELLAMPGLIAGPPLTAAQEADVRLAREVALKLGAVDVGQTVVVYEGTVLAVEAVEGTDECIRRAGRLGGPGAVVGKFVKPQQDRRVDRPAIGAATLEVMREARASVLAVEAGGALVLDVELVRTWAPRLAISVVGVAENPRLPREVPRGVYAP